MTPGQALEHAIERIIRALETRSPKERARVLNGLKRWNETNKGASK